MRRSLATLALGTAVLGAALSGCSGDDDPAPSPSGDTEPAVEPTVSAEGAEDAYRPLVDAVVEAVAGVAVPGASDGDPARVYRDDELDSCVYASERYEFDTVFGEETSWDDVRAAVDGALGPEGFELTDQLDIPGGFNGFDATTDDGAVLEVRSKLGDPSTVSLDAPVTGDC